MPKRGILLVNLGSPTSTSIRDVGRYLGEFLMDPYVIDSPWLIRKIVVSGFILPFRPKRTAHAYERIWEPSGSPLLRHSRELRDALMQRVPLPIELAMRYGEPNIGDAVRRLVDAGVGEIVLVPLYPHHADSTRTTTIVAVREAAARLGSNVSVSVIPPFHSDPGYLDALTASIRGVMPDDSQLLLFSYHGLPERHITSADPTGNHCLKSPDCCDKPSPAHATCYRHQVFATSRGVATRLGLTSEQWRVSFQSRLGRLPWLTPYTDQVIDRLPTEGVTRLTVVCPAFVADNLETLEEIGLTGRERFLAAGGEHFTLVPCLNADPAWVDVLATWCSTPESTRGSAARAS
ncbi:MAG TPA: ferrochelatase [Pseudomonadales bacterium]|nr:ferrochelatase [Pseudomonadales bacterium]